MCLWFWLFWILQLFYKLVFCFVGLNDCFDALDCFVICGWLGCVCLLVIILWFLVVCC